MIVKAKEIGNRKVSIYKTNNLYLGDATIKWVITSGSDMVKDKVCYMRDNFKYHSDEYKSFKENNMSSWITGGTVIPNSKHKDSDIITPSNVLVIDCDACDNDIDILTLKNNLFLLKFVYAVGESVSGKGLYIIIPIKDYLKLKDYYIAITTLLKNKFSIICDAQCNNIARLRYMSYDKNIFIKQDNEDIIVWDQIITNETIKDDVIRCEKPIFINFKNKENEYDNIQRTLKAMELVIDNGYYVKSYNAWYHLGCELKNHPNGYNLFFKASKNNPNHNDSEQIIKNKWNQCSASGINEDLHRKWQGMLKNTSSIKF